MTIEELKKIVKDATQQAFDGQRISPDEKGNTWSIIAGERLWFRTLLDSVEAEPIKHGRWINVNEGKWNTIYVLQCSACGEIDSRMYLNDSYCPHCGARMDEVERNE